MLDEIEEKIEAVEEEVVAEAKSVEEKIEAVEEKVAAEIKAAVHHITHIGFGRGSADEAPTQTTVTGDNHG